MVRCSGVGLRDFVVGRGNDVSTFSGLFTQASSSQRGLSLQGLCFPEMPHHQDVSFRRQDSEVGTLKANANGGVKTSRRNRLNLVSYSDAPSVCEALADLYTTLVRNQPRCRCLPGFRPQPRPGTSRACCGAATRCGPRRREPASTAGPKSRFEIASQTVRKNTA